MVGIDFLDALGSCDEAHELDVLDAFFFQQRNGSRCTAAGSQHGVDDDEIAVFDIRQFAVIFDRFQRLRVAVEADVADFGRRDEVEHALYHAQAGAQDRDDAQFLAADLFADHLGNRRFDFNIFQRQVPCNFVTHEHGDFFQEVAEIFRTCFLFPHECDFVLNERMVHYLYVHV